MVSCLDKRVKYQLLQRETVDCVPHTKVSFAWNSDVSYMPLPWPFSFQYVSHRRGGCFEANQNATPQKTSRALPALLLEQGLRATWSCNCCPVDTGSGAVALLGSTTLLHFHHLLPLPLQLQFSCWVLWHQFVLLAPDNDPGDCRCHLLFMSSTSSSTLDTNFTKDSYIPVFYGNPSSYQE